MCSKRFVCIVKKELRRGNIPISFEIIVDSSEKRSKRSQKHRKAEVQNRIKIRQIYVSPKSVSDTIEICVASKSVNRTRRFPQQLEAVARQSQHESIYIPRGR